MNRARVVSSLRHLLKIVQQLDLTDQKMAEIEQERTKLRYRPIRKRLSRRAWLLIPLVLGICSTVFNWRSPSAVISRLLFGETALDEMTFGWLAYLAFDYVLVLALIYVGVFLLDLVLARLNNAANRGKLRKKTEELHHVAGVQGALRNKLRTDYLQLGGENFYPDNYMSASMLTIVIRNIESMRADSVGAAIRLMHQDEQSQQMLAALKRTERQQQQIMRNQRAAERARNFDNFMLEQSFWDSRR